MKIESIQWRKGADSRGIDAAKAYKALELVRKKNGGEITDDAVVKAAKPVNSVLHNYFEWDDKKAAAEHRRNAARRLVKSVEVIYKESPEKAVRAYEVKRKESRSSEVRTAYSTVDEILADPCSRDQLIAAAIREAMSFRRRFIHLNELSKVMEEITRFVDAVGEEAP